MLDMYKVSVIVPIYNVEKYIEECLLSLLNQTLRDIEIICVNDGTPDDSMRIVKKYKKQDKRIKIINQKNMGIGAARNRGLQVAQGEYIYFLDSDDWLDKGGLKKLYEVAVSKKLDVLYFNGETIYESEQIKKEFPQYEGYYQRNIKCKRIMDGQSMFKQMYTNGAFRSSTIVQFFKKSFLEDNKILFPVGIIHEDEEFSLKAIIYANRTYHINKDFYKRRIRDNSVMTRPDKIIRSSYGYYHTLKEILPLLEIIREEDNRKYFERYLNNMRKKVSDKMNSLIELEEQQNIIDCEKKDYELFHFIISDNLTYEDKILDLKEYTLVKEEKISFVQRICRIFNK